MKVRGEVGGIVRSVEMAELAEVGSRVIPEVSKGESSIRIESEGRRAKQDERFRNFADLQVRTRRTSNTVKCG